MIVLRLCAAAVLIAAGAASAHLVILGRSGLLAVLSMFLCVLGVYLCVWSRLEWHGINWNSTKAAVLETDRVLKSIDYNASFIGFLLVRIGAIIGAVWGIYYLLNWRPVIANGPHGRPENPGLAIAIVILSILPVLRLLFALVLATLACAAVKELWWLLVALLDQKKPLEDEKAHGRAAKATETRAKERARGVIPKPPWSGDGHID